MPRTSNSLSWLLMLIGAVLLAAMAMALAQASLVVVPVNDGRISFEGRFSFDEVTVARFDWSGVSIAISVPSDTHSVGVLLEDQGNQYNIWIDGNLATKRLNTTRGLSSYELVSFSDSTSSKSAPGASAPDHVVKIEKRTEALFGIVKFHGFVIDSPSYRRNSIRPTFSQSSNRLLSPRRIEFIGDSLSCAYGNEGTFPCTFSADTENAAMSFVSVTARNLNAEYHIQCWSGKGVVRNYGDPNPASNDPFPVYYTRSVANDANALWNFSQWEVAPTDAVVITLGANDFSPPTSAQPTYEQWSAGYHNLISFVRSNLKDKNGVSPQIFCVCGPLSNDPCDYTQRVVDEENAAGKKGVHFVSMKGLLDPNNHADYGCDWHPSVLGDAKMASVLTKAIATEMKWSSSC